MSEGSCDTENWRNDAENSALNHKNKIHKKNIIINCNNILQYSILFAYFI